jgi:phosphopantothenoylcysteine decarboxylase/phosphopantothenate--cysteine ligase
MRVLITAGPTREPLDEVRFISNRSSGSMGLALAAAAREAGHAVTLLLGPGPRAADVPAGVACHRFESCADLARLLDVHFGDCDCLVMAAAVADYRLHGDKADKMPRQEGRLLTLTLEPTPDLVAGVTAKRRAGQLVVAFALEPAAVMEQRGLDKLRRKGVDAVVANPLATMESREIRGVLLWRDGRRLTPPGEAALPKPEFARWLWTQLAAGPIP